MFYNPKHQPPNTGRLIIKTAMVQRKPQETNKYDWVKGRKPEILIYENRLPSKDDPGIMLTMDPWLLQDLLHKGYLTGDAWKYARGQERMISTSTYYYLNGEEIYNWQVAGPHPLIN